MSLFDFVEDNVKKHILGQKPAKILKCPKCKTKVPSWKKSEKRCSYCGHKWVE